MNSLNKHNPINKSGTPQALFIGLMIAVLIQPAVAQQKSSPLPTDLLPKGRALVPPMALSSDAQWVAYTVQDLIKRQTDLDERYIAFTRSGTPTTALGCNVWITNTRTGEARNLTQSMGNNWGPSWSPNGSQLAFYSDRSGKPQLWIWNKSDSFLRSLSDAAVHQWSSYFDTPVWTPDSSRIVVKLLPERLTVEQAANLTVLARESSDKDARFAGSTATVFQFSPSPVASNPQDQGEPKPQPSSNSNIFLGDLAVVDVSTGRLDRVARGFRPCWYAVSPDGANLAFVTSEGSLAGQLSRKQFDVVVVSLNAGSALRVLARNVETPALFFREISWSPDGKSLSYVETENGKSGDCYIINLAGGEPRRATDQSHPSFYNGYRAPLWSRNGESLYFLGGNAVWRISIRDRGATELARIPNKNLVGIVAGSAGNRFWSGDGGRSMIAITREDETKQAGFFKIDLTTGKPLKLLEENKAYTSPPSLYMAASDDARRMIYGAQDVQSPEDLWLSDFDFQNTHQLTRTNPELSRYQMGASRLIEWRSTNGERLRGALLLPPDYQVGKRYPLIVNVYGGNLRSNEVNEFGLGTLCDPRQNMQLLATRGYAVLSPDAPLRVGTPMQDLAQTVLPGVDKAIELGIVDPERLGIMGRSYGGYSTLSLLVQTTRFKAAVSWAGVFNLFASYGLMTRDGTSGWTDWAEKSQGRMGGTPWEHRERYIENSPIFYLDRVQTPLMLGHGSIDTGTPSSYSEEVFVGLRRLGKEVVYNKYDGESHVIFNYANQIDFWNRMIAWFDSHLKTDNPATSSSK
jgi:dipeptidyl aminopeptidase/acylaminoacyl peptidase